MLKRMLENADAKEVGDNYMSFDAVVIQFRSKICKELKNCPNDDPTTLNL